MFEEQHLSGHVCNHHGEIYIYVIHFLKDIAIK